MAYEARPVGAPTQEQRLQAFIERSKRDGYKPYLERTDPITESEARDISGTLERIEALFNYQQVALSAFLSGKRVNYQ